jgi:hypothetical protein
MLLVVYHLGALRDFDEFFKEEASNYEFKTTLATIPPINIDILK